MQDKENDSTGSSADNWRQKVAPIPDFLQKDVPNLFVPEPSKGNSTKELPMKGIAATVITGILGAIIGYGISFFNKSSNGNSNESLNQLVSNIKTQADSILNPAAESKSHDPSTTVPHSNDALNKGTAPLSAGPAANTTAAGSTTSTNGPATAAPAGPMTTPNAANGSAEIPQGQEKPKATAEAAPIPRKDDKKPAPIPGPVFMGGTNSYGPPPLMGNDLFNANSMLKVEYDPDSKAPENSYEKNETQPTTFKELIGSPSDSSRYNAETMESPSIPQAVPIFHLQLGAFVSKINAYQLADRLGQKGYNVAVYEGSAKYHPTWYYVRLNKGYHQQEALQAAKQIQRSESFVPTVVQLQSHEKKIR